MKWSEIHSAYTKSFLWIAVLIAGATGLSRVVELIFIDFVHGNPHRPKSNALEMMALHPPIFGLVAIVGAFLVLAPSQCFQALVSDASVRRRGRRGQSAVPLALPLTAVLTWYCYDYLTPSNVISTTGDDWTPYRHGLTFPRYLSILAVQLPATLFSLAYCEATVRHASRTWIVATGFVLAIVVAGVVGYGKALDQYKFLVTRPSSAAHGFPAR
jgi:hypothetical protein